MRMCYMYVSSGRVLQLNAMVIGSAGRAERTTQNVGIWGANAGYIAG